MTVTVTQAGKVKAEGRLIRIDEFFVSLASTGGAQRTIARKGNLPKVDIHDPLAGAQGAAAQIFRSEHPRSDRLSGDAQMIKTLCLAACLASLVRARAWPMPPDRKPASLLPQF